MKTQLFVVPASLYLFSMTHSAIANPAVSAGYSQAQVDGMSSRIVDNLWARTDYWWHYGAYTRIIAEDRIITEADPQFAEPYATGGWLLESLGNNADAEKYYSLGTSRNPQNSYLWYNLGFFYYNTKKNYPKAIISFTHSSSVPGAGINDWKMLAHSYERNHQLDKAIAVWEKLHATYANDGVVIHNLAEDQARLAASVSQPSATTQ